MNNYSIFFNGVTFKTGDRVTCKINKTQIVDAKIIVFSEKEFKLNYGCGIEDGNETCDYNNGEKCLLICQNQKRGNDCENIYKLLGYKYGWLCVLKPSLGTITDYVSNLELQLSSGLIDLPFSKHPKKSISEIKDNLTAIAQQIINEENIAFHNAIGE